ncbi:MAG: hypothetical protein R2873_06845 [Caldilineaceae bacterium]
MIDTLPAGVTVTDDGGCTLNGGELTCVLGVVAAGQTVEINLSATAADALTPGTRLENQATVTSTTDDRTQADNLAIAATNIVGAADLSLSKAGPSTITAGTEIEYIISVANNGPSASGVDVKDALPQGTTLIEATIQRSGDGLQLCGGAVCPAGRDGGGRNRPGAGAGAGQPQLRRGRCSPIRPRSSASPKTRIRRTTATAWSPWWAAWPTWV